MNVSRCRGTHAERAALQFTVEQIVDFILDAGIDQQIRDELHGENARKQSDQQSRANRSHGSGNPITHAANILDVVMTQLAAQ